jgi:hypothetical protein
MSATEKDFHIDIPATEKVLRIDIPVKLAEAKEVFSIGAMRLPRFSGRVSKMNYAATCNCSS